MRVVQLSPILEPSVRMKLQPGRISRNWCYTASGSGAIITDAGVLSVNGATTVDGASTLTGTVTVGGSSTLTGTVKIGGGYTNGGISAINTDAEVLSANGEATVDGASTLSGIVASGGGYTNGGSGATITDAGVLSANGASTLQGQSQLVLHSHWIRCHFHRCWNSQCKWNYNHRWSFDLVRHHDILAQGPGHARAEQLANLKNILG